MKISKSIFSLLIMMCSACSPANFLQEWQENNQLANTIVREEELWQKLEVDNYQIEIRYIRPAWYGYTLTIRVKENKVLSFDVRCDPGDEICKEVSTRISPDEYTIQGVFDELKKSRTHFKKHSDSSWSESLAVTFDTQYHYPKVIDFDVPELLDDEYMIEVLSFEVLDK